MYQWYCRRESSHGPLSHVIHVSVLSRFIVNHPTRTAEVLESNLNNMHFYWYSQWISANAGLFSLLPGLMPRPRGHWEVVQVNLICTAARLFDILINRHAIPSLRHWLLSHLWGQLSTSCPAQSTQITVMLFGCRWWGMWPAWIVLTRLSNVSPHICFSQKHSELIDMLILMSKEYILKQSWFDEVVITR